MDGKTCFVSYGISSAGFRGQVPRELLGDEELTIILRGRAGYEMIYITNEAIFSRSRKTVYLLLCSLTIFGSAGI